MLARLLKGDGMRKTRFHNYKGQMLDAAGFLYLPHSVVTALLLKVAGHRPELPWLGYRAINHLDELITKNWRVLEFGSGMSTIWLARRCGFLKSVETNENWYAVVKRILAEKSLGNVDYQLCRGAEDECLQDCEDAAFDLVLVDGYNRDRVMGVAISKVKRGGYIYLDNSDVPYKEHQTARDLLLKAAGSGAEVKIFNDLCPTQVCVSEGILASMTSKPRGS